MPHKYKDKVEETTERITKMLKEGNEEEPSATYILIKTKIVRGLAAGLGDAIDKMTDGEAKEILLHVKAGLDWMADKESYPLDEVINYEKRKTEPSRKTDDPWA